MRKQVRNRIIAVINRNCYWLNVVPDNEARSLLCTSMLKELTYNPDDIVVRVSRKHNSYRKGCVVTITSTSLCEAIADLSADRYFALRAEQGMLTVSDVEKILLSATSGAMVPDLFDY